MANICFGNINFTGDIKSLKNLEKDIKDLIKTIKPFEIFSLAERLLKEQSLDKFTDVSLVEPLDETVVSPMVKLYVSTAWNPKPNEIVMIANHFKVNFRYYYEELGNQVYGCYVFDGNYLQDFELSFEQIDDLYDEDGEFDYDEALELLEQMIDPD